MKFFDSAMTPLAPSNVCEKDLEFWFKYSSYAECFEGATRKIDILQIIQTIEDQLTFEPNGILITWSQIYIWSPMIHKLCMHNPISKQISGIGGRTVMTISQTQCITNCTLVHTDRFGWNLGAYLHLNVEQFHSKCTTCIRIGYSQQSLTNWLNEVLIC